MPVPLTAVAAVGPSQHHTAVVHRPTAAGVNLSDTVLACHVLQLYLTTTHLCIVMEYAAGGELFDRIVKAGRFSEDEARYFFQQLICGVDYCHQSVRAGQ